MEIDVGSWSEASGRWRGQSGVLLPTQAWGLNLRPVKKKKPKELFQPRRQGPCLRGLDGKGTICMLIAGSSLPWIGQV